MISLADIKLLIEDYLRNTTWSSASPAFTNVVKDISHTFEPTPDIEREGMEEPFPQDQAGLGTFGPSNAGGVLSTVSGSLNNPVAAVTGVARGLMKFIPHIAIALAALGIAKQIRDLLIGPGGPFDIRFRREIQDEVISSVEREEKAKIRQGLVILRITSSPTLRGEQGIGQTGQVGITGIARYDNDFENFQKGLP